MDDNLKNEIKSVILQTKEIGTEAKSQLEKMKTRMDRLEEKYSKSPAGSSTPARNKTTAYLSKGEKIAKEQSPSSLGDIISGLVSGKDFQAKSLTTTVPGGGTLLAHVISSEIIDEARALTVADQVGVRWYPFASPSVRFPRVTESPVGEWKEELESVNDGNIAIDGVLVEPKTLMAVVTVSRELLEDAPLVDQVVSTALFGSLARQLDYAVLRGNDNHGPTGIRYTAGIQTKALNAVLDRDELSIAVEKLALENFTANGIVLSPRDYHRLARQVSDSDDQPLTAFRDYANIPQYATTAIPSNIPVGSPPTNTGSEVYVADWSNCIVGVRSEFSLEFNQQGNAFNKHAVEIKLVGRYAVAILQPKAFYVITDVKA